MRLFWIVPGVLLVLSLNCSGLPAQKGGRSVVSESPWELRLSAADGVRLRAVLYNRTKTPQTYLYHSKIQPTELVLTAQSGERVEPFDTRAEAKFDNTVYREMFRQAAPSSDVTLTEASVESDRTLRWGPFLFTNLAPGVYRATAV